MTCNCPCNCPEDGQPDDDGTPGWCDPCRMNIHQERAAVPLADVVTGML